MVINYNFSQVLLEHQHTALVHPRNDLQYIFNVCGVKCIPKMILEWVRLCYQMVNEILIMYLMFYKQIIFVRFNSVIEWVYYSFFVYHFL